ncbi:zinc metalloprotease HtpX [Candidatus Falkowbacteria bacterium HGW-Falkowbacteria-1]|uniref:Protease HtpX homolog n=1 Tax=Candidatus Falkowbacteria bacterium HGW-Falkowbacteria-1 TaxID=2013768 RepID=A0A2N2EAT2_9BACT|nr:MAG: zinc metalloprotease HtpX [Candidatus Falkowbacteria bacterium HGW-Falkowbacteria-1]
MAVGYVFSLAFEEPAIVYIAVFISFLSAFISYWFSDKIVLSMSNAHELKIDDNRELYRLVENLCITTGSPLPKIYMIDDLAPNAFATGRNPKNAVIAVTTGLLEKLDRSELEGVIAHELSHIKSYDILIATLTTILVGMIVILSDIFVRWAFFRGGSKSSSKDGSKILIIIIAVILSILAPIFAYLMQFAISRKREFLADADGALTTRYPEGLARALEKISQDDNQLRAVNKATAHLYIASPLKEKKKAFFAKAFMTHPPIEERISALRGMEL